MAAWDRQEKEPPRAFAHFTIYRDLGPDRTLTKASRLCGVTEGSLKQESSAWNWTPRCDQWDAHVQAIGDRAYLTETARRGRQRAQAHMALLAKALEALRQLDVKKANLAQIASALKVASEGMRLEEGLETARVSMEVTDARVIISRLPPEIRQPLLRALADDVAARGREESAGGVPFGLDGE